MIVLINNEDNQKKLKAVQALLADLPKNAFDKSSEEYLALDKKLNDTQKIITDLGKSKRRLGSAFLRSIMGRVSVKLWNEGERLQFKQEYNRFKETFLPIYFILPLIQLFFGWTQAMHQIQSFFTFYYYTSLAIRENILLVNGSRIKAWWIYHHYVTLFASLLFLLINKQHPLVIHGVSTLTNWNMVWQASVMIFQNHYQRQRHYTQKALAKKTAMDVRTTEVIDENPRSAGLYRLLIPALYFTYVLQFIISLTMFYVGYRTRAEFISASQYVQVYLLAICWMILPIGNFITLSQVINARHKRKKGGKNGSGSSRNKNGLPIDMKMITTYLFFAKTVAMSVMGSFFVYVSHFVKSVSSSPLIATVMKKSSKKKHSSSKHSSSKKKDEKSDKKSSKKKE